MEDAYYILALVDNAVAFVVFIICVVLLIRYHAKYNTYSMIVTGSVATVSATYMLLDYFWSEDLQTQLISVPKTQDLAWVFYDCCTLCFLVLLLLRIYKLDSTIKNYSKLVNFLNVKNEERDFITSSTNNSTQKMQKLYMQNILKAPTVKCDGKWDNNFVTSIEAIIVALIGSSLLLSLIFGLF